MNVNLKHLLQDVANSDEHAELINGNVVIENRTTVSHNMAVMEIVTALKAFIAAKGGTCKVFSENVALYVNELCDENNFFLPDVMVVCDSKGIREDGIHTIPMFIAEVTSESTRKYDYCEKLEIYRKMGVQEYWIVDMQRKSVYKYLASDNYIPQTYIYPESMKVSIYPGLMIDMSSFMNM